MPMVKREGGVLKAIPPREKMYIAFNMAHNPTADPRGLDDGFRMGIMFKGMSGSEDELRTALRDDVRYDPSQVYGIFEIVRLIEAEEMRPTMVTVKDRNMR